MTEITPALIAERRDAIERTITWFEANPDGWESGGLAFNQDGDETLPSSPAACSFCFLGRLFIEGDMAAQQVEPTDRYFADGSSRIYVKCEEWLKPLDIDIDDVVDANDYADNMADAMVRIRRVVAGESNDG